MTGEMPSIEAVVVERYTEILDEARRAWMSVGVNVTVGPDLGVTLTDAADSTLTFGRMTGGMYFGLSCYLQELLNAPVADPSQIRAELLSAL